MQEVIKGQSIISHPNELLAHRAEFWQARWTREASQSRACLQLLIALRQFVARPEFVLEPVTPAQVTRAVASLPDYTGIGLDNWQPRALKAMPGSATRGLAQLLTAINTRVAWPAQALLQRV